MTQITDLQQISENFANMIASKYKTKVEWVCLDGTNPDLKQYPDKMLSFHVADPVYNWGQPISQHVLLYHSVDKNEGSEPISVPFSRTETETDTFSWSITEGLKYTASLKLSILIAEVSGSYTIDLSSTQGKTETKQTSWTVGRTVTEAPYKETEITWLLERVKKHGNFTANVFVSGYVAIWFKDKIDYRDPNGNNKHWLWFVTPATVVSTVGASGFTIHGSSVSFNATGAIDFNVGIETSLDVKETPLNADGKTFLTTYKLTSEGKVKQEISNKPVSSIKELKQEKKETERPLDWQITVDELNGGCGLNGD